MCTLDRGLGTRFGPYSRIVDHASEPAERHFGAMGVTRPIDVMRTFLKLKHRNPYLKERPALALHRTGDATSRNTWREVRRFVWHPRMRVQLPTSEYVVP
jgi:hypothetical protein